jgi:hypothetical protein
LGKNPEIVLAEKYFISGNFSKFQINFILLNKFLFEKNEKKKLLKLKVE